MHGVAERQQAGLAEQDVVGQREDDRDADQAEGRQRAARREDQRQDDQRGDADQPDAVEAQAFAGGVFGMLELEVVASVMTSRVPIRPMGRTIRMSTSSI